MSPAMPSSRSRRSASTSRPSNIRSPALSWVTRSIRLSHSGVAYSGWLPTSRYSLAPLRRNTLLLRPQETTRRNRYLATSSGDGRRPPRARGIEGAHQPVLGAVGRRDGVTGVGDPDARGDWPEDLLGRDAGGRRPVVEHGRGVEVPLAIRPLTAGNDAAAVLGR